MAKPLTRAQALENRAFLSALRRTGNVRLAAREVGLAHSTMLTRRKAHPAFAVRWDAALVVAAARLGRDGGKGPSTASGPPPLQMQGRKESPSTASGPSPLQMQGRKESSSAAAPGTAVALPTAARQGGARTRLRTRGGEEHVVRLASGAVQVRRAQAGKLTPAAEQAFLSALSATCNFRLAAAAVGAAPRAFYRRRGSDPGFAREVRMALQRGYEALELALLESSLPTAYEHDEWRRNDPPAMPPMTANQALQLMYLHQKEARLLSEPDWIKRRQGESREAHSERLAQMAEERARRAREAFLVAEAERWANGEPAWGPAGEAARRELGEAGQGPSTAFGGPPPLEIEGRMGLPDLAQVTGWSKADPDKAPHDPTRALFGGWRIEDMEDDG